MMNRPELLAPAGNVEKMKYAFAYGADAVYAGAPQFSLRARENGFKFETLQDSVRFAHEQGKKFYLTVNILAHNRKIQTFQNKLDLMMATQPDALIMADPGLIAMVKERYPEAEIHLSVQANVMNWQAVKFWKSAGVSRVILSRELSIDEIKEIKDKVPEMELEAFVHGAICIAHSGRCLLSNYFNYRDANLGVCTNACRWPYKLYSKPEFQDDDLNSRLDLHGDFYLEEKERPGALMRIDEDEHGTYIMNAKDLMAIEYLDEMRAAGIDSFKIEGRTKSIYYLSIAVRAYRRAIDNLAQGKDFDPSLVDELEKLHNRGYTPGFLISRSDQSLQRYEEGRTNLYTQEFGGVVKKSEPGRILLSPRNKIAVGDRLEVMTPNRSYSISVQSMEDLTGQDVEAIHGGSNQEVWIPFAEAQIPPCSLVSKIL